MGTDSASAYEKHAREFLGVRDESAVGVDIVERWARSLDPGTDVLEVACGGGIPITRTLLDCGLDVWALDSSPTLLSAFRARFPGTPARCERVQDSDFFGRRFGAVIAIGLLFLLDAEDQVALIRRASGLLVPGGRFLFSAPIEVGTWTDLIAGQECRSLGREKYEATLAKAGFRMIGRYSDAGNNHHYDAERLSGRMPDGTD